MNEQVAASTISGRSMNARCGAHLKHASRQPFFVFVGSDGATEAPVVLCVDDDVRVLAAVSRVLQRAGLRVITAAGAASALEHLERARIDVVISDAHMPGMTGIELLTRFMRERPSVARILMSGSPERPALESGAAELLLSKPTPPRELVEAVMRIWQHKRSITRAS